MEGRGGSVKEEVGKERGLRCKRRNYYRKQGGGEAEHYGRIGGEERKESKKRNQNQR